MIDINELTIGEVKKINEMFNVNTLQRPVDSVAGKAKIPVEIGEAYLFRTVTHIEVGRVKSVMGAFVTLEDASWIADTGRYHYCLRDGVFNDVEPYPLTTTINSSSLINFAPWPHKLPKEQK